MAYQCDSCNYNANDINNDDINVCRECFKREPSVLITQTNAVKEYPIPRKDLNNLRKIMYKGMYTTYLFLIQDIHNVCVNKYGSEENYKEQMRIRVERRTSTANRRNNAKKQRHHELDKYLKEIGLSGARSDSILCTSYIEYGEKSGYTKKEIGIIMLEMKFYYERTKYSTILRNLRDKEIKSMRKWDGYYRWTHDDEESIRNDAKKQALKRYIVENINDVHKCILEIPQSLQAKYNAIYKKMKKDAIRKQYEYAKNDLFWAKRTRKNDIKRYNKLTTEYNDLTPIKKKLKK